MLMILKSWKELKDKLPLFPLTENNKLHLLICLIGSEERKFSQSTLRNSTDFSDTERSSLLLRPLELKSTQPNGNLLKDLST